MKLHSAILYTNNLEVAVKFYRDVLGLVSDYVHEGRFASFDLGNAKLGIKQAKEEREIPGHQTVFLEVEDIEKIFTEFQSKSEIKILKPLIKEDWATNFSVLDPDDNKVQFVQQ